MRTKGRLKGDHGRNSFHPEKRKQPCGNYGIVETGCGQYKNSTYRTLLDGDLEYAQIKAQEGNARSILDSMELSPKQRDVVEQLTDSMLEAEYHVITNAYLAGMLDGYKILKSFDLTYE